MLRSRGIKPYREEFKFILTAENQEERLQYARERQGWTMEEWKNCGFTDEMSIEIGGTFGPNTVWRDKGERWHTDCTGAKRKGGASVMCWGLIGYGFKGPFFVWDAETDAEKKADNAIIKEHNDKVMAQLLKDTEEWKKTSEWQQLRETELAATRVQRAAERAGAPKVQMTHRHKARKYEVLTWQRSKKGGIDSWRYVKCLARPILWPYCKEQLRINPNFQLMEDNAPAHKSPYTTHYRTLEQIPKILWPRNSPDFNPIERIWTLMKRRIQRRRGTERITTMGEMKRVLQEEWDKITIEEINREVEKLPTIMQRCIDVNGNNNYHA